MPRDAAFHRETPPELLDAAERLFAQRGYASVRLREIAEAAGLHHSTLYHYAPGGKAQLYREVMTRHAQRHQQGLTHALEGAPPDLRQTLYAVSDYLISQPPLNTAQMAFSDLPQLEPEHAAQLAQTTYDALRLPIAGALRPFLAETQLHDPDQAALLLVSIVQSVHLIPSHTLPSFEARTRLARQFVDMILDGWRKR